MKLNNAKETRLRTTKRPITTDKYRGVSQCWLYLQDTGATRPPSSHRKGNSESRARTPVPPIFRSPPPKIASNPGYISPEMDDDYWDSRQQDAPPLETTTSLKEPTKVIDDPGYLSPKMTKDYWESRRTKEIPIAIHDKDNGSTSAQRPECEKPRGIRNDAGHVSPETANNYRENRQNSQPLSSIPTQIRTNFRRPKLLQLPYCTPTPELRNTTPASPTPWSTKLWQDESSKDEFDDTDSDASSKPSNYHQKRLSHTNTPPATRSATVTEDLIITDNIGITQSNFLAQEDNIAYFLVANCAINIMITKILVEKNKIDQQSLLKCDPGAGNVLVTRQGETRYIGMVL